MWNPETKSSQPTLTFLEFTIALGFSGLGCRDLRWLGIRVPLLGGSCVVISGAISPLIWVITIAILLIILLRTTHEPPSKP